MLIIAWQKDASGQWTKGGPKELLVDKASAIQRNSSLNMPVDEDHSNMVKFGTDDQNCQAILSFILDSQTIDSTPPRPGKAEDPAMRSSRERGAFGPDTKDEYREKVTQLESKSVDHFSPRVAPDMGSQVDIL